MIELVKLLWDLIWNLPNFIDVIIQIPLTLLKCFLALLGSFSVEIAYLAGGIIVLGLVYGFVVFLKEVIKLW